VCAGRSTSCAKASRVCERYAIADGDRRPAEGEPTVVICVDEFGPLNLVPHPGRQWASRGGGGARPRRRRRASYKRPHGVRHMFGALDLSRDHIYGHIKRRKASAERGTTGRVGLGRNPQPEVDPV
jgi:hypothetical protein